MLFQHFECVFDTAEGQREERTAAERRWQTDCYLSPSLKQGQRKPSWTQFGFLEIARDFITVKLHCGLTSFQLQHCLGRMTVIRKSSGKHDTVSSSLRRFPLLDSLAVNYFWEQCYKIVLESADGLDSYKNT